MQFTYDIDKYSRRFFLTPERFDNYIPKDSYSGKEMPYCVHTSVEDYALAPVSNEFVKGVDYVLDFDGHGFEENMQALCSIVGYFEQRFDMTHFKIIQTNGNHDGFHIKIPYQSFMEKNTISRRDIFELRKFYLLSTWFLNRVVLKKNEPTDFIIELKDGNEMSRSPFGWNEKTHRPIHLIKNPPIAVLEGENYMKFICEEMYPMMKTAIQLQVTIPRYHGSQGNQHTAVINKIAQSQAEFPPCFARGIWEKMKEGVNQELIIFSIFNYLTFSGWQESDILQFIEYWFAKNQIKEDMRPVIEKHKGRKFEKRVSCQFLQNKVKICIDGCNRVNPFGT